MTATPQRVHGMRLDRALIAVRTSAKLIGGTPL
jgi:hypothetical protein